MAEPGGKKSSQPLVIAGGAIGRDLAPRPGDAVFAQQLVGGPDPVAEEVDASTDAGDLPFREFQSEFARGEPLDFILEPPQMLRTAPEHHDIVHVTIPEPLSEDLLQVPIQRG